MPGYTPNIFKNKHVRSFCAYAYTFVAVIFSENNIRKTSVFVYLMLRAYVYSYPALVKTSLKRTELD